MANINIGGRLHSTATGNTVAGANEILDDSKGKKQSVINQETDAALAGKQDTIADLSTIRTGAAAGATAYQKPSGGIPETDLNSSVQHSLELADSSVQAQPVGSVTPPVVPSDWATAEQVSQLEAKLNNLANTRYYGIFTSASQLPDDASENGYAYVGSSTPLAIYEFDGEDWNDTGVTVNSIQGEPGEDGVGFASVATPSTADGTATITLTNGDTITLDLNHDHPAYPKYTVCTQAEYDALATKDSDRLYLIPEV